MTHLQGQEGWCWLSERGGSQVGVSTPAVPMVGELGGVGMDSWQDKEAILVG